MLKIILQRNMANIRIRYFTVYPPIYVSLISKPVVCKTNECQQKFLRINTMRLLNHLAQLHNNTLHIGPYYHNNNYYYYY